MANTASGLLESDIPQAALKLNPLNADARIQAVADALDKTQGNDRAAVDAEFRELSLAGKHFAPGDPRFLSLMGLTEENDGNPRTARSYYERALALQPVEFRALVRLMLLDLQDARISRAVDRAALLATRWQNRWPEVQSILTVFARTREGQLALAERFQVDPLRSTLINGLLRSEDGLPLAYAIMIEWKNRDLDDLQGLANRVIEHLVRAGQPGAAHTLHLQMLDARVPPLIFNASFDDPPLGNSFDWSLRPQSGVDLEQLDGSLEIVFRGNPIRFQNVFQLLRLPAGQYSLTVDYETPELSTPKSIRIRLNCRGTRSELLQIELAPSTTRTQVSQIVSVPAIDCPFQEIFLDSEFVALSWRNRFEGKLILHQVSLETING